MTASTLGSPASGLQHTTRRTLSRMREYFASDASRSFQTVLGVIWVLDGALQFQPFMYSKGFIQTLTAAASGQPQWLASSMQWAARIAQHDLTLLNTLFAAVQVIIGLGLLYRPTVKPAIVLSLAWSFVVWWFAEGFGMLFAGTANPLTGAPGAVLLYAIVALLVWPSERAGGLLGARGARVMWAALWLGIAWMWLLASNSSANGIASAIMSTPGAGWLHDLQSRVASTAHGHGLVIALVLALISAGIGVAVATNCRPAPFLILAIVLNLAYWVIGQGFGGIFYTNSATDPNAGPLFVLLASILLTLPGRPSVADQVAAEGAVSGHIRAARQAMPSPATSAG